MVESADNARRQGNRDTCRPILIPTYIENLNSTARAHGLVVSPPRIVREEVLTGYSHSTTKEMEHLVIDWRGTGAQLRSLGCIRPSWSFPIATIRGPGGKRLDTKWGIGGYVHVDVNEEDVIFEIDYGDAPLGISVSDGVETISFDGCVEHYGTRTSLVAADIADEQRLSGKKPRKDNGRNPDEPHWWRVLQPDGTIVFGIETEFACRRRKEENERMLQAARESQQNYEVSRFKSDAEWTAQLEYHLDGVAMYFHRVQEFLGKSDRFKLDQQSDVKISEILMRSRSELAAAFVAARVTDSQRVNLRVVVDNTL